MIIVLLVIGFSGAIYVNTSKESGSLCEIYSEGELVGSYSLDVERDIKVANSTGGVNIVSIANHSVCIKEANCPEKVCVNMGYINNSNESICCAPNRLMVILTKGEEGKYDAITQ